MSRPVKGLTSIAYTMVRDLPRSAETPIHRPGAEAEEAWPAEESVNEKHSSIEAVRIALADH